jgi:hypothetical protein
MRVVDEMRNGLGDATLRASLDQLPLVRELRVRAMGL